MSRTSALEPDTDRRRSPIARIVAASLVGTTIEWYDFFLYGLGRRPGLPRPCSSPPSRTRSTGDPAGAPHLPR